MAVYTEVSNDDLASFVAEYDIGTVLSCKGIAEGVENSNYLLSTDKAHFILTLYEKRVDPADLPYFLNLMEHLARKGIACPTPVKARDGRALRMLAGKPAAIVSYLEGLCVTRPMRHHCAALGAALARFHEAGSDFSGHRENSMALRSWNDLFRENAQRSNKIAPALEKTLAQELSFLSSHWPAGLPQGVIHGDLFPDNVFFIGEKLSGLIDFYFACNDLLAYDLAICLNAWCFEADNSFNITKAQALLAGYQSVRAFDADELASLPLLARGSALRFLMTRLHDWFSTADGAVVRRKDPLEYLAKLRFHQGISGPSAYGL